MSLEEVEALQALRKELSCYIPAEKDDPECDSQHQIPLE